MTNGRPPFRADHVGSLLRPAALRQEALEAVAPLGPRGEVLAAIARVIVDRHS